ncbi:hypothetical protein FRB94_006509 [Tulasnella sp. JGI-2019a]|nr:hypothetical protein FRB94_006509 [Tulasnella sp. JGI-2019a]KAG9000258.1 hypothetical protein FRB93_012798 [Tulasnella sp. JGI-2019a]KAG9035756.1 hypothetical protein FRB95_010524 [Tulasnella sp. JGI-2019a]
MSTSIKLHGSARSTCTQKVMTVAYEKGLEVELVVCDFTIGEHKSAAWLEKQPFGQVPYLDDEGFILYESRAIGRYIATKYANQGTKLLPDPKDLKAMALADQALSVEISDFDPSASGIVREAIFVPRFGGKTDPVTLQQYQDTLKAKLEGFERILTKQAYLGGNEIGLADLYCLSTGNLAEKIFPGILDSTPNVARWWKSISSRPSWKKVLEQIN